MALRVQTRASCTLGSSKGPRRASPYRRRSARRRTRPLRVTSVGRLLAGPVGRVRRARRGAPQRSGAACRSRPRSTCRCPLGERHGALILLCTSQGSSRRILVRQPELQVTLTTLFYASAVGLSYRPQKGSLGSRGVRFLAAIREGRGVKPSAGAAAVGKATGTVMVWDGSSRVRTGASFSWRVPQSTSPTQPRPAPHGSPNGNPACGTARRPIPSRGSAHIERPSQARTAPPAAPIR